MFFNVIGEPESYVFGSIVDGVFEGKISSPDTGAYYVEKARRYFPNETFHSVIYHENDVADPHEERKPGMTHNVFDCLQDFVNTKISYSLCDQFWLKKFKSSAF